MTGNAPETELQTRVDAPELADTVRADERPALGHAPPLRPGARVGRYQVLSRLGAGAMGVVLAAHDPELDRKVAIKLLLPHRGQGSEGRERLQREAQALAKLGHPNVVTVHDVGIHDGQVFVAMEHVEGQTLASWLRERRPWPEVLLRFEAAGRGLAAAHEAGLVHRDFKPDNVMLGADGRVRVMDFGLARADEDATTGERVDPAEPSASRTGDALATRLTETGTVMGTPAYMSPEQAAGRTADARSDQFGFCVALYEALYGERPYPGRTLPELMRAVVREELRPAPKGSPVPAWVRRAVVRGLARRPEERHPSMDALLQALADDPARRRRRWLGVAGIAAVVVAGAWAAQRTPRRPGPTCDGMDAKLAGVWDAPRRAELREAMTVTGLGHAADTWARVEPRLDEYALAWVDARRDACEATRRGEQPPALLDLRMACLDGRLRELRAQVDVLAHADREVVDRAVTAVASLPGLDRCADAEALQAEVPPPDDPATAQRVIELDERLAEASALERAGKYEEGLVIAEPVTTEAQALGYAPLRVRALLLRGGLERGAGRYAEAEASLERAYDLALEQRMPDEAASAASSLVEVVGSSLGRPDDGLRWGVHAEPLVAATGSEEARATLLDALGMAALAGSQYERAQESLEQALVLRERVLGPEHPRVAATLDHLGNVADARAAYSEAQAHYRRALAIYERVLGPEHPDLAAVLHNLGVTLRWDGELVQARETIERALAITEASVGAGHPNVAASLFTLGDIAQEEGQLGRAQEHCSRALAIWETALGEEHPRVGYAAMCLAGLAMEQHRYDEARAQLERALDVWEHAFGPEDRMVAGALNNLGQLANAEGDHEAARQYYERALAIYEAVLGEEHVQVAMALDNLASAAHGAGDHERAAELYTRALAMWEATQGPEHPDLVYPLVGLGKARRAQGRAAEALPWLERALRLCADPKAEPGPCAHLRYQLARALWEAPAGQGRDRPRARQLGDEVRDALARLPSPDEELSDELDAWLAELSSPRTPGP
ncbi:MAG: serine/threonine protein kinase [Myxococcales bacterium]|nr:serine/threonine protein kinase [Myxococcales bacterium]